MFSTGLHKAVRLDITSAKGIGAATDGCIVTQSIDTFSKQNNKRRKNEILQSFNGEYTLNFT